MSVQPYDQENVTIFWDFETTQISNAITSIAIHEVVKNLRDAVSPFGLIKSFRAYWDFSGQGISRLQLSSLSSSGVSLIECPGNGRKDLPAKIMLVDLITHAWDNSPPHTFVVITADRDVAYGISTLRMRGYRVVVISPSDTAEDLSAQASVNLELTRALLGLKQDLGVDEFFNRPVLPPAEPTPTFTQQQHAARSPSSTNQYQKPRSIVAGTNQYEKPSAGFELRDLPTGARRDSVFSFDRRKFDVFRGMEDLPETSNVVGRGSFGLGNGPLFPRPQSRAEIQSQSRADSAQPNVFSTGTLPAYGSFEENGNGSPHGPGSKGKQRELPLSEPEHIAPYPGGTFSHIPYSGPVFEPFGEKRSPFQSAFSFSPPRNKPQVTRSSSNSSASSESTSRESHFSLVQFPESNVEASTAPTSADNVTFTRNQQSPQKPEIVIEVVNESTRKSPPLPSEAAPQPSPPISSSVNETAQKAIQTSVPSVNTLATVEETSIPVLVPPVPKDKAVQPLTVAAKETARPTISSNTPPTMIAGSSKRAAPAPKPSVPASFQLLAEVLRKNGAMKNSALGGALLKSDPNVYSNSKYKKLRTLVLAAAREGIVEQRLNQHGEEVWRLTARYA